MELPRRIEAEPGTLPRRPRPAPRPARRGFLPLPAARLGRSRQVRGLLLMAAALGLGALATVAAGAWLEARVAGARAAAPRLAPLLVAARDLPAGTRLSASLLAPARWPVEALPAGHFAPGDARLAALEGRPLRAPVPAGLPLVEGHVTGAGAAGGPLAALLAPGMRAIAIPVSAASAVAGLIAPGDRVDLLLTRTLPNGRTVTATVATGVKVLGLDQRLDPAAGPAGAAGQGDSGAAVPATVTLEATPRQAEAIALLETLGRVTLALRRPDEAAPSEPAAPRAPAWDTDALGLPAAALAPAAAAAGAGAMAAALPSAAPLPMPAAVAVAGGPEAAAGPGGSGGRGPARGGPAVTVVRGVEVVRGGSHRGEAPPPPASAAEAAP